MSIVKLVRTILLFPFYLYLNLLERVVRFFLKIVYFSIKMAESVPVVGPRVTLAVDWAS